MFFFIHSTKIMAQSSGAACKGQRKGRNATIGVATPPSSSISVASPSATSGDASAVASAEITLL
jgi:hypothetical protein